MKSASTPIASSTKEETLRHALAFITSSFQQMTEEAQKSAALLDISVKTPFAQQIERTIEKPAETMFELSADLDSKVKSVLSSWARAYISHKANLVASAYEGETKDNALFFYVELKNDEPEIRSDFYSFYDHYEHMPINEMFPIHFQFVSNDVLSSLIGVKKIF